MLNLHSPEQPVKIELDDEAAAEKVLGYLADKGAFVAGTTAAPVPTDAFYQRFYERTGTNPTHVVVTSEKCDDKADGLTVYPCGYTELERLGRRLGAFVEKTASGLAKHVAR